MNNDLITIIVPIYNGEQNIDRCINSIIKQTYKNIEIILINDGSTDQTGNICDKYATEDSRIKVIHKRNNGVSSARNDAIKLANGKYIGFVDVDDYVDNKYIEILYTNAIKNNVPISMCNYYIKKGNKIIKKYTGNEISGFLNNKEFYKYIIGNYYKGVLWNKLFKRDIFIKDDGINFNLLDSNIHICEDLLFLIQNCQNIEKFYYDNNSFLYYHCLSDNSAYSSEYNEKKITEIYAYDKIIPIIEQKYEELLLNYKEIYVNTAISLRAKYLDSENKSKNELIKMEEFVTKYYNEIERSPYIGMKRKMYYKIYYKYPKIITKIKKIYHDIKKI